MSIDKKKLDKAKKLGISVTENMTETELDSLIEVAEDSIKSEKDNKKKESESIKKTSIILKDTEGNDVDQGDYFFPDEKKGITDTAPVYFNRVCGYPVDREDLLEVFNNIFKTRKGFLFYKLRDKEIYLIIVPRKYAKMVGKQTESQPGDFQKHALSFVNEGSVNTDTLKMKLNKISNHVDISREPLA